MPTDWTQFTAVEDAPSQTSAPSVPWSDFEPVTVDPKKRQQAADELHDAQMQTAYSDAKLAAVSGLKDVVGGIAGLPELPFRVLKAAFPQNAQPFVSPEQVKAGYAKVNEALHPVGQADWVPPENPSEIDKGVGDAAAQLLSGFTAPENIAALPLAAAAPELVGRMFQGQMLAQTPQQIQALIDAKTTRERAAAALSLGAGLAMPAAIEAHMPRPEPVPIPDNPGSALRMPEGAGPIKMSSADAERPYAVNIKALMDRGLDRQTAIDVIMQNRKRLGIVGKDVAQAPAESPAPAPKTPEELQKALDAVHPGQQAVAGFDDTHNPIKFYGEAGLGGKKLWQYNIKIPDLLNDEGPADATFSVKPGSSPTEILAQAKAKAQEFLPTAEDILKASPEQVRKYLTSKWADPEGITSKLAGEMTEEQLKQAEPLIREQQAKAQQALNDAQTGKLSMDEAVKVAADAHNKAKIFQDVFARLNRNLTEGEPNAGDQPAAIQVSSSETPRPASEVAEGVTPPVQKPTEVQQGQEATPQTPVTPIAGHAAYVGRSITVTKRLRLKDKGIDTDVKLEKVSEGRSRTGKRMVNYHFNDGTVIGVQVEHAGEADLTPEEAWQQAVSRSGGKEKAASPPVVREAAPGSVDPNAIVPAVRKIGGEVVPGEPGDTHGDIIKKEGIAAEDLDQRGFSDPEGKKVFLDREAAAKGTGVEAQFEPGAPGQQAPRLHSTDLNREAEAAPGETPDATKPPVGATPAPVPATKPAEPATPAVAKVEGQVAKVAATEGQRPAKAVKSELVARLEKAIEDAPETGTKGKVTIEIPGDGTFTVFNNKADLQRVLDRAKKVSTTAGTPKNAPKAAGVGDIGEQADKVVKAYGSPEAAYQSAKRQREALPTNDPETPKRVEAADALLAELYQRTKAGQLEAKAEADQKQADHYRAGANGFQEQIGRIEKMKRLTPKSRAELTDLKSRYAENQRRLAELTKSSESLAQEAAKEKATLEAPAKPAEPPITSMGGMAPADPLETAGQQGSGQDIYGIAQRVREERARAGQVGGVKPGAGIAAPDSVIRGRELIAAGADPEKALAGFEKTNRLSADDIAVTRAHGEQLSAAARRIEEKFGTASPEYMMALKALTDWDSRTKPMQTEWHKIGQAQQGETDIDTGTFTGLAREYKASTGKDFTPKQAKEAVGVAKGVKTATDAEATAKDRLNTELAKPPVIDPKVKSIADRIITALDTEASKALARIKARRAEGRLFTAIDPTDLADYAIYGASKIAKGTVEFGKWSKEMLSDIGAFIEPHLKQIWDAADKELEGRVAKLPEAVRAPVKQVVKKLAADPAKQAWQRVREYLDKGTDNFDDIRHKLATDMGISVNEATKLLTQNQTAKRLADDVWKKQQESRRVQEQAKRWLTNQSTPGYLRAIQSVPRILFGLKVGFHGTVALGTHAPTVAFQPRFWSAYIRDFGKMYRMVGSPEYYERQVQDLMRRPNFITARRAGLVNDPFVYEDYTAPDTAKYFGRLSGMGNRGYSVLKILRQDMFDQMWDKLPESAQAPEVAEAIADGLNHATGVVKGRAPRGTSIALFAPRLEASRAMWLAGDPIRATKTFLDWKNASEGEKHFAVNQVKEKAWVFGTLASMLAVNQAMLSLTGSKQQINFTDPNKGDFLHFKGAGMQGSYGSPLLTMARLPLRLWSNVKNQGKLNKVVMEDENVASTLFGYARSQSSPFTSIGLDLGLGRDYQERPLPRAGFGALPGKTSIPKRLKAQGVKPYTWPEFVSEATLPIPAEEALKEVWGNSFGGKPWDWTKFKKAMATISFMASTGGRIYDDKTK